MAHAPAPALILRENDGAELRRWLRSTTLRSGLAKRARIILLAADGAANSRIAEAVDASVVTVLKWRARYEEAGISGLTDAERAGRPRRVDPVDIVSATLVPPPKKYGVTHWSSRLLAQRLGVGNATVARAWRTYGIQPWRSGTFKFSTDPELIAKVTDVVGLYLAPPENAIVLCVDEKSQVQALDRIAPLLPMRTGDIEKRTHDYKRHGTTTLFAALEIATGQVTAAVKPEHRHQEFLAFLRQLDRAYPGQDLHLVLDNYATHKTPEVKAWLLKHPRFRVHFTPASGSWLNLVEVWFGIIDRQAIRRGVFTSVKDLNKKIRQFIDGWNESKHPFVWTKTADEILVKTNPQRTSETRHEPRIGGAIRSEDDPTAQIILHAATAAFAEHGFAGTSIREISRRAGLSSGSLYNHFHSKQDILTTIVTRGISYLVERTAEMMHDAAPSPPAQLCAVVAAHVSIHAGAIRESRIGNSELHSLDPSSRLQVIALRDQQEIHFLRPIEAGLEAGIFHSAHPREAARFVAVACTGVAQWFRAVGRNSVDTVIQEYQDLALATVGFRNDASQARTPSAGDSRE